MPDSSECTIFFSPKSEVHYLYHVKSNNIIDQRKTTNTEKHFYPWLTWLTYPWSKIYCKYCTNWLRVISRQENNNGLMVVIHQETIHELASLRFLKLNLECKNIKMGRITYEDLFFSFMRLCSKSSSCNRVPQLFLSLQSFL